MLKILIWGIGGKVGTILYQTIKNDPEVVCVGGVDKYADPAKYEVPIFKDADAIKGIEPDVIIDFSRPEALPGILGFATAKHINVVFATTGNGESEQAMIKAASEKIAIFQSSNMSLGVNMMIDLAKQTARFLNDAYDIEIIEQHHNQKIDAPSGTALSLADAINGELENKYHYVCGRKTKTEKREHSEIGIHSIRGGTIVGKHDVMFIGCDEVLTISHEAQSRAIFARGSIRAAKFISDRRKGYYNMNDIIARDYTVNNVSFETGVALITFEAVELSDFITGLGSLAALGVNVDMISQSLAFGHSALSFTLPESDAAKASDVLKAQKLKFTLSTDMAKLTVEGFGMEHSLGAAGKILGVIKDTETVIEAITTSERKIACCIKANKVAAVKSALTSFFNL